MIVRTVNQEKNSDRLCHCDTAMILPDKEVGNQRVYGFCLIVQFSSGRDATYPLSTGDLVFYMNDEGKTIDKDFRMKTVKNS